MKDDLTWSEFILVGWFFFVGVIVPIGIWVYILILAFINPVVIYSR